MRISDWSSDVCSSDLLALGAFCGDARQERLAIVVATLHHHLGLGLAPRSSPCLGDQRSKLGHQVLQRLPDGFVQVQPEQPTGARKSVGSGKRVSVRVDPGGRRYIKKKKKNKTK